MPTYTHGFPSKKARNVHFLRHGAEFPFADEVAYEEAADAFLGGPLPAGAQECVASGKGGAKAGRTVRFDPATDEFAVLSPDGWIMTYFKPKSNAVSALSYFKRQC